MSKKVAVVSVTCSGFNTNTTPPQGQIVITLSNGHTVKTIGTEAYFLSKQLSHGFLSQADYDFRVLQLQKAQGNTSRNPAAGRGKKPAHAQGNQQQFPKQRQARNNHNQPQGMGPPRGNRKVVLPGLGPEPQDDFPSWEGTCVAGASDLIPLIHSYLKAFRAQDRPTLKERYQWKGTLIEERHRYVDFGIDWTGRIYLLENGRGIRVFTATGKFIKTLNACKDCLGLTFDKNNQTVIFGDCQKHTIQIVDAESGELKKKFGAKELSAPRSLALTRDGNLVVLDCEKILIYSPDGEVIKRLSQIPHSFSYNTGTVTVDPNNGNILYLGAESQLSIWNSDGEDRRDTYLEDRTQPSLVPSKGLMVEGQGRILVASCFAYKVLVFSPEGKHLYNISTRRSQQGPKYGPTRVAMDFDGNVLTLEEDDEGVGVVRIYGTPFDWGPNFNHNEPPRPFVNKIVK